MTWKKTWTTLKASFNGFLDDKILKLSAALAYYTIFAMGPLLFMIVLLCGFIYGKDAIQGKVFNELAGFTGKATAEQLQYIIKNAALMGKGVAAAAIGGIILLVSATSIFAEIQDSLNMIWCVKPKPKSSLLKYLQNRFISFSIIIGLGFLAVVSLALSALIDGLGDRILVRYPGINSVILHGCNLVLTIAVIAFIFAIIFKVLPDARIKWREVIMGAVVTAVLFVLGKLGISLYIASSHVDTYYGTAGALIVVLLWVYYSSVILYYGAEFTKAYAISEGKQIEAAEYAVCITSVEIDPKNATDAKNQIR